MQRMRRLCLLVRCRATPWASQARILGVLLARPLLLAHTTTHGLTMFATRPRPSRRRDKNWGLSWGTRTLRIFASIAQSSCRQHDPQHEAGMSRSRPSVNPAFSTPPILKICVSYQDKGQRTLAFVGACFDTEGRPRAVQPRCAMWSFEPGLAAG